MTSPPTPPSPLHPTSPLHRALRAAKPPRRRSRRPQSTPPPKPSTSTTAISGSPPPAPVNVSSARPPSFFKSPKDLGTRLLNNIRSSSPDQPRRRRDDLFQTLLTFPEHDAATVAALLHRYDGDQKLVQETLRQFRAQPPSPVPARPPSTSHPIPSQPINHPPSSGDPPSDPKVSAEGVSPSSPRDASSPASMRSLRMSASVATTAPAEQGRVSPGVPVFSPSHAPSFDRPSEALAADVGSRAKPVVASPRAWSTPGRREEGPWETEMSSAGVSPLSLRRKEGMSRKRRDARRLYAGSMGSMSVGSDMGSLDGFGGGGKVSGMKRGRSFLAGSEGGEEGVGGGNAVMSPGSWTSSEMKAEEGPAGKDKGTGGVGALIGFRRNRPELEMGKGEERFSAVEPTEEEQGFGDGGGMGRRVREVRTVRNGRVGDGMGIELETYRMLLRKVERMEGELREFRRHSEEMRRELEQRVEHGKVEQRALEQRHEAMAMELEENHRRGVTTERYLDLMRRELVQAVGRRRWKVVEMLRSTVNNGVYYVLAYLVPVVAFMIRGVRDGVGWVRRRVRGRGGGDQVGRLRQ